MIVGTEKVIKPESSDEALVSSPMLEEEEEEEVYPEDEQLPLLSPNIKMN